MPPSSDIYLVGPGYTLKSKKQRLVSRLSGQRTFYIGPIHMKTGLRFPVDLDFVRKYFDQIEKRVEAGTLVVEYKLDKLVDPDELKTLAFGSDAEKAAYEESIAAERDDKAKEQTEAAEQLQAEKEEARALSVLGRTPAQKEGASDIPVGERLQEGLRAEQDAAGDGDQDATGAVPNDNATRLTGDAGGLDTPVDVHDNLQGTRAETMTSPRALADQLAAEHYASAEPEASAARPARSAETDPDFKPLPDGWQKAPKPELLAWCQERGIDTSDMPSNKELRRRLDDYVTKG